MSKYNLRIQAGAPSTTNYQVKDQAGGAPRVYMSSVSRNQAWSINRSHIARSDATTSRSKSKN